MKIPKSWSDITVGQYIKSLPSNFNSANELDNNIERIAILCRSTPEYIKDTMSIIEIEELIKSLSFLTTLPKSEFSPRFKVKGRRFRVDPNIRNHNAREYTSAMKLMEGMEKDAETVEKNLHLLISNVSREYKRNILGRRIDKKDYDVVKQADWFKEYMPMSVAYPIGVFFCSLSKVLTSNIKVCSILNKAKTSQKERDLNSGVGG